MVFNLIKQMFVINFSVYSARDFLLTLQDFHETASDELLQSASDLAFAVFKKYSKIETFPRKEKSQKKN